jgi:multisubunit Na+/H+ antiporter MnhC subunit
MPIIDAFVVAAIVTAFVIFAVVLAWAEYRTRHLPQTAQKAAAEAKRRATAIMAKAA